MPSKLLSAFTPAFLANLAGPFAGYLLAEAGGKIRRKIQGGDHELAFYRCVEAGVYAAAREVGGRIPTGREQDVAGVLSEFFRSEKIGKAAGMELAEILSGREPDVAALTELFGEAGYEAEVFPELRIAELFAAFEAAFLTAAAREKALQPILQTENLLAQTRLQQSMLSEMVKLNHFLGANKPSQTAVLGGALVAEDAETGRIVSEGARNISVERDVFRSILASGDGARVVQVNIHIENQYVGGDSGGTASTGAGAEPPDRWETAYLTPLLHRCDPLDLAAVDETCSRHGQAVRVSDVYTKLFLKGIQRRPEESVADAVLNPPKAEEMETRRAKAEEKRLPIQAVEAIGGLERVVILGQPGGGKSTLVNHVAARLARLRSGEPGAETLKGWDPAERPLPVRIVLRDFAAWLGEPKGKGAEKDVWEFLEHLLAEWGCSEFFPELKRILVYDGGVVFFDGLDEVGVSGGTGKRARLVAAIDAFSRSLPQCRTVVTCREYAYSEKADRGNGDPPKEGPGKEEWRLPAERFPAVVLDEFHKPQIQAFLESWFAVHGRQRDWSEKQAGDEAAFLFQAIQDRPHLKELAPNPLLLTLMAIVHGASGLPENRADLYDRAVRLLLAHWENRIVRDAEGCRVEPSVIARLKIPVQSLRGPLERLAVSAHERQETDGESRDGRADIPMMDVLREFRAALGSFDEAEQVVEYIENRAGLLQGKGDGNTFLFPHRTFQEYLAATGILDRSDPDGYLADAVRRNLPFWREVFLLAAGASRKKAKSIYDQLDALLPEYVEGKPATAEIARYARLAAQAIHETGFMEHVRRDVEDGRFRRIHERVQRWLLAAMVANELLKPSERNEVGTALNWVGDPRFREDFHFLPTGDLFGLVNVHCGSFLMGSDKGKGKMADDDETPQHKLTLPEFFIARFPVTVAQFRAYAQATGNLAGDEDSLKGPGNHPVSWVSWHEAMAYCRWLQIVLESSKAPVMKPIRERLAAGWRVRLPTEAEWELAARGTDGREFPWGEAPDSNRANYLNSGIRITSAVGCFSGGETPFECLDMSGNVWEWTVSLGGKKYPYCHNREWNKETAEKDISRVVRGGSFLYPANFVRCAFRDWYDPNDRDWLIGFRCCVSPDPTL